MTLADPDAAAVERPPRACKIVVGPVDPDLSQRIAGALAELIEPLPDAVARFEEQSGWRTEAYYQEAPDAAALAAELSALLAIPAPDLTLETVPDENWVALSQAALPPVEAGRFTVHGSHDRHRIVRGPNSILIDAGEAFGTAHHATTLGCLVTIDRLAHASRPRRILDLGCGSGVLAIAAQRCWPRSKVVASDIDPIAVDVARANARLNGAQRIELVTVAGLPRGQSQRAGRYDLLIANILAGPLIRLAPSLARAVKPGGRLVLSGLLTSQAREVSSAYLSRAFSLERRLDLIGWTVLTLKKRHQNEKRRQ